MVNMNDLNIPDKLIAIVTRGTNLMAKADQCSLVEKHVLELGVHTTWSDKQACLYRVSLFEPAIDFCCEHASSKHELVHVVLSYPRTAAHRDPTSIALSVYVH
jgi:predicted protein tyrosine phosphatase